MYKCGECGGQFGARSLYLMHVSRCGVEEGTSDELESTIDDTDDDPNWSPSALIGESTLTIESPITDEQAKEAALVQNIICDNEVVVCPDKMNVEENSHIKGPDKTNERKLSVKRNLFRESEDNVNRSKINEEFHVCPKEMNFVKNPHIKSPDKTNKRKNSEKLFEEARDNEKRSKNNKKVRVCPDDINFGKNPRIKSPDKSNEGKKTAKRELFGEAKDNEKQSKNNKEKEMGCAELRSLKTQMDNCKRKRKLALKVGRISQSRRLTKSIKKLQMKLMECSPGSSKYENVQNSSEEDDVRQQPSKTIGRKENYCLYCDKLVTKFGEHLQKIHSDKPEGKSLLMVTSNSKTELRLKKTRITDPIRKNWNSIFNNKSNVEEVVVVKRRTSSTDVKNVQCLHCKGIYRRDKLSVHLKRCPSFVAKAQIGENVPLQALKRHSTQPKGQQFVSNEFQKEILNGIIMDEIVKRALEDELIMKFSNDFHHSRREQASRNYVVREMRDLSRLLIEMKQLDPEIQNFKMCINPKHFDTMTAAALNLAGFEQSTGEVKTHSIAYRLSQPIKDSARLLLKEEQKKYYEAGTMGTRNMITQIQDFLSNIETHWKNKIGRICTKSKKFSRADRSDKVALESDIRALAAYLQTQYRKLTQELQETDKKHDTFDMLTHVLVSHIMLLVRRRPVDFKNALLRHFINNLDKHDDLLDMAGNAGLTENELKECHNFHIFYVPGKNLEIVPIVLLPIMKEAMDTLLKYRSAVGIENEVLFMLSGNKFINPVESLRLMKKRVNLKKPDHMTGNGLRHQAATFSRIHSTHPQYQDFLATTLGHSLTIHKKHYDLPLGVLQKILVCPILNKIMTGVSESTPVVGTTVAPQDYSPKDNSDKDKSLPEPENNEPIESVCEKLMEDTSDEGDEETQEQKTSRIFRKKRWTQSEQDLVICQFGDHILKKTVPKRSEVVSFLKKNSKLERTVAQVMLFVRNHCVRNQKDVTPKINRILKKYRK